LEFIEVNNQTWNFSISQGLFDKWRNDQQREIFSPGKAKNHWNTLCIS